MIYFGMNRKKKITDRNKILEEEMKKNLFRRKKQIKCKVKFIRKEKKNGVDVWPVDWKTGARKQYN